MTVKSPLLESAPRPDPVVRLNAGGTRWQLRESWRGRLFGPEAPDWFSLRGDPRAMRIKIGRARETWRVALSGQSVFAKVFNGGTVLDRLRRWLSLSPAEREWRASREAEVRGVPAVRPLALGLRSSRQGSAVFLSEGLDYAVSLAEAWQQDVISAPVGEPRTAANRLSDAVARFLATAHERGFVHRDGHPGNILIRVASEGDCDPVFVDVQSARITRQSASLRSAVKSLAQLDLYFHRSATRAQRLRFWQAYVQGRPSLAECATQGSGERRLLTALARTRADSAVLLARHRDRRLRRSGKYFTTLLLDGGWRATVTLQLERRHVFLEAGVPDRTISDWRAIFENLRVDSLHGGGIRETAAPGGVSIEVQGLHKLPDRVSATLWGSPQRRAFERCHRLRHRDIPSELILAYAERRLGWSVDMSMLIRPLRDAGSAAETADEAGDHEDEQDRDRSR